MTKGKLGRRNLPYYAGSPKAMPKVGARFTFNRTNSLWHRKYTTSAVKELVRCSADRMRFETEHGTEYVLQRT